MWDTNNCFFRVITALTVCSRIACMVLTSGESVCNNGKKNTTQSSCIFHLITCMSSRKKNMQLANSIRSKNCECTVYTFFGELFKKNNTRRHPLYLKLLSYKYDPLNRWQWFISTQFIINMAVWSFLANVNSSSCSLYVIDGPSVCLSSVVCL